MQPDLSDVVLHTRVCLPAISRFIGNRQFLVFTCRRSHVERQLVRVGDGDERGDRMTSRRRRHSDE